MAVFLQGFGRLTCRRLRRHGALQGTRERTRSLPIAMVAFDAVHGESGHLVRGPGSQRFARAFTLVELTLVVTLIGLLMAILLPALQAARESARRLQCAHHLRQLGLAMHSYHNVHQRFPAGIARGSRLMWSGQLLSYLEEAPLYESIDLDAPWTVAPNSRACASYLSFFRCPSTLAPRHLTAQGIAQRVPCTYLACSSGTVRRESGPPPLVGRPYSNGIFYIDSRIRIAKIRDGTSQTLALGEAIFDFREIGPDWSGQPQFVDHWYIGTTQGNGNEISESMGTTAVPINTYFNAGAFADERELAFGSWHGGGALVNFADGHVSFLDESLDGTPWSAMGTRNLAD